MLAGFKDIPGPSPTSGVPTNYWRGVWIFADQPRNKRRKTLKERRTNQESRHEDQPEVRLVSLPVGQCTPQQLMEALMLQSGCWHNFDSELILAALEQNRHLWLNFMMLPLIGEDEDSNRLYSNLGYALRDLGYRWHADTLYVWSRDDDCVYPLVDFGKAWMADNVQVMEKRSIKLQFPVRQTAFTP
ncbi:MAG: hypothetical protein KME05_01895 [Gloeocapsa sp. UFS-A4-WI-NPMV-4B04]|nr:hypothetical protein [Gloeocapsa sp. UFS-A4-WI-NPMV-4B04]